MKMGGSSNLKLLAELLRGTRGASAVEFAILLPFLLVMLFGIVEFGIAFFNKQMITNASREGARAGIVSRVPRLPERMTSPDKGIVDVVEDYTENHLITFGPDASVAVVTTYRSDAISGDDLRVTVTYPFQFLLLPNFIAGLGGSATLRAETLMKYE